MLKMQLFLEGTRLLLSEPTCFLWIIFGVTVGITFGAIPGLTTTMAIATFVPLTYSLSPVQAMCTIIGLFVGGISGGLISAILLNIPGTPSSVGTCFDGRPMALKGQADKAIGAGILFSFLGTLFSIAALVTIAPILASIAIKFGPHEYFAVIFFSLSLIITLSSSSLRKGLIAGILGLMLATVGLDPIVASPRFTFNIVDVRSGFNTLTVMLGMYAIPEILLSVENLKSLSQSQILQTEFNMRGFGITFSEFKSQIINYLRSSAIGTVIGILPGIGGGTSNIIAYTVAKEQSKNPEEFGKGKLDGIVASEAANNATIGSAMIPLLTLGIPGDTNTAIMLGALAIHGITPGPLIFENHGPLMYGIFIALVLASFAMLVIETLGLKVFVKALETPKFLLFPMIFVVCVIGAFGLNNRLFDAAAMLVFGILGYMLCKLEYPRPPLILGFVLGSLFETHFRRALMASQGDISDFFTRPISAVLIIFTLGYVVYSIFKLKKASRAQC